MADTMKCPKCKNQMEEGSLIEKSNTLGMLGTNESEQVHWGNIKSSMLWGNSVNNKIEITSYRCVSCGYLESYAK